MAPVLDVHLSLYLPLRGGEESWTLLGVRTTILALVEVLATSMEETDSEEMSLLTSIW